jgi:hypothetical protein
MGAVIKYLRQTTSGAANIGLGPMINYLRRITSTATGIVLGTTINYLRGAASSALEQGPSTCDAQRAPPKATAQAPR